MFLSQILYFAGEPSVFYWFDYWAMGSIIFGLSVYSASITGLDFKIIFLVL